VDRPDGHGARADAQRISQVLAGLAYPAAKWRILAQVDHYGADAASRAQLWGLPVASYRDLHEVLAVLGLASDRRAHRPPAGGVAQVRPVP
jgi:hypothetical protein